jgi:hypothetical protein
MLSLLGGGVGGGEGGVAYRLGSVSPAPVHGEGNPEKDGAR